MEAREIADHLRDSRGIDDEDAALMLGRWIASRLDMDPIWVQVDQLFDEVVAANDGCPRVQDLGEGSDRSLRDA